MSTTAQGSFDIEYLTKHGHLSVEDARNLHVKCSQENGMTDLAEIVASWNLRDPEAPWESGIVGVYVHQLTNLVYAFMADKVHEASKDGPKETPLMVLVGFNPRRAARGKGAARIEATWPDGEVEFLWMDKDDIIGNLLEHGSQQGLVDALHAYAQMMGNAPAA
ncbi:hypothetical protein OKA04_23370 [Luteolibacter flavescens]|uniref:Uncharacterized protein n=1 Tax=Luteolibacter flavescens TaxID=1859460 RepID=A0ABT3FVT8_9BACT|nr:hypothetical protein [Luteolibacter flavescens]MCW1887697.1 hypothetical protein [Luteolibacter flavescens]